MTGADAYDKPIPQADGSNQEHWEGAKEGVLRIQRCQDCGTPQYPGSRTCAQCLGTDLEWIAASGKGRIWSFCTFHHAYFPGFSSDLPYTVILVELDEGPKLYSNLVGAKSDAIWVGQRVRAVFERVTPQLTLVKFEPDR